MEQLKQLAQELQLDEQTVQKMQTIVESAVAETLANREEGYKAEIRDALNEYKEQYEESVAQQVDASIQAYIAERRQEFETSPRYEAMVHLVENIKDAMASLGVLDEHIIDKNVEVAELKEQVQLLQTQLEEQKCSAYLSQVLQESDLSQFQKERVLTVLSHTKPQSLHEFKSIVDNIVDEYSQTSESSRLYESIYGEGYDGKTADETKPLNESATRVDLYAEFIK